ncbi:hypothetical protein C8J57DRAFT_1222541 [Mycena rebaudengoi]|nr:hypothetical protein C8J57DRAFT_1222541 [Mycena rebaudengoi]
MFRVFIQRFLNTSVDTWFNKISVLGALASDFMTVFACLSVNYLYLVTHWGNEFPPQDVHQESPVLPPVLADSTLKLHAGRSNGCGCPLIAPFIFTGLVGAGATATHIFINPSYTERDAVVRYVTIWLSGSAATDVIITGLLVWTFRTLKTNFVSTTELLRCLSITSVRNGSITTVMTFVSSVQPGLHTHHLISLINLVVFTLQPETNSAVMIEMTIGRIYTLSMLANLNNRTLLVGQLRADVEMNSSIKFNSTGLHPLERTFESDGSMNSGLHTSVEYPVGGKICNFIGHQRQYLGGFPIRNFEDFSDVAIAATLFKGNVHLALCKKPQHKQKEPCYQTQ